MTTNIEQVHNIINPVIERKGYILWSIEYESMDDDMFLRVLIDRQNGLIDMDELVSLTEIISELIDNINPDPFPNPYILDVSSPGAERSLNKLSDYEWALHKKIIITLKKQVSNEIELIGELIEIEDNGITICHTSKNNNVSTEIDWSEIKEAKLSLIQDINLISDDDFIRVLNKIIQVNTYTKINGNKIFKGKLIDFSEKRLVIEIDGELVNIPRSIVSKTSQVSID